MTQEEFVPLDQAIDIRSIGFDGQDCTFSAVFRWFRNEHSLDSWVYPDVSKDKGYYSIIVSRRRFVVNNELKGSYEEAELETLKKLIEVVKGEVKLKDVII